jgi:2-polyprenyl-6-methoxyphenol hydroxylase-like FAD-dependent oxidoreductase
MGPRTLLQVTEGGEGAVTVETARGERLRCKLLVGADGNRSVVRTAVQPGAALMYTGASVWRFFFETACSFLWPLLLARYRGAPAPRALCRATANCCSCVHALRATAARAAAA